jgi:2-polyprenyl-3-methyl-5-hydroxy-6-metoxy-1,4-benzoquinol methylase
MERNYRDRIYEKYATNFQDASEVFDAERARVWGRTYRYYLRDWLPENDESNILDVACGGGKLLHFFGELGFKRVTGVDISPEQVLLAKQVSLSVHEANALDYLEANAQRFDLIIGLDIVEHLNKQEVLQFLDACAAALKPGGRLVLQTPNADSPWGMSIRYGDFTHEVGFNAPALGRLLKMSGFIDIEAREQGPVPLGHTGISKLRFLCWHSIRLFMKVWNLVEIGNAGSGVFTRVFLISGRKI